MDTISNQINKRFSLTSNQLKIIAIVLMIIDHISSIILVNFLDISEGNSSFFWLYTFILSLRIIGRLSFPIFAYLIVNGFFHTSDKKNYLTRLIWFAFISELFYDFGVTGKWIDFSQQNVFFTLSIGLAAIWSYDVLIKKEKHGKLLGILSLLVLCMLDELILGTYGAYGVLTIFIMYLFFNDFKKMSIWIIILNIVSFGSSIFSWGSIQSMFEFTYNIKLSGPYSTQIFIVEYLFSIMQLFSIFSLLIINCYNGQKGKNINRFIFYGFYPVHLFIFGLISLFIKAYIL